MALTVEAKAPSFALTAAGGQEAPAAIGDPYRSVAQAYSALKPSDKSIQRTVLTVDLMTSPVMSSRACPRVARSRTPCDGLSPEVRG